MGIVQKKYRTKSLSGCLPNFLFVFWTAAQRSLQVVRSSELARGNYAEEKQKDVKKEKIKGERNFCQEIHPS